MTFMQFSAYARNAVLLGVLATVLPASTAHADFVCADDPAQAVEQARKALEADDPAQDRHALVCLAAAVATLDTRLQGLSDGSIPFEGQAYMPQGWVMNKVSSSREAQ
jgi:hypothetical protein